MRQGIEQETMKRCWTTVAVMIVAGVSPAIVRSQALSPSEKLNKTVVTRAGATNTGTKTRFEISPEVRETFAGLRELVLAYTRSHSGRDLDEHWASAFESVYAMSDQYEWLRYQDAENAIREAWDILDQAKPEDPQLAARTAMILTAWRIPSWISTHPRECAALTDEAARRYISIGGADTYANMILPHNRDLLRYAMRLPEHERCEFYAQRVAFIRAALASDQLDFFSRNNIACIWAIELYTVGEVNTAGEILDTWRKMHGDRVLTSQYCYARFFAAIYGAGGWEVANEMVAVATELVKSGESTTLDPYCDLILKGYYSNMTHSDYELKRRGATHCAGARNKILEELRQWQETTRSVAK